MVTIVEAKAKNFHYSWSYQYVGLLKSKYLIAGVKILISWCQYMKMLVI